jgi:hypothetical protein
MIGPASAPSTSAAGPATSGQSAGALGQACRSFAACDRQIFCVAPWPACAQAAPVKEDSMTEPTVTHIERRKIEAGVIIPLLQAFQRAIGPEQANAIARDVILELARKDGARWAAQFGCDLAGLEQVTGIWANGGAQEIAAGERSDAVLSFSVTRCGYAEYFKALGLAELGFLVHCNRDFAMVEGFSRDISLTRTQTIMQGASHCDFRYERKG